ncbi:amidase [Lolliginicoccus lacisalsi]|uniref:amidase n=1 Tax=Lolliginicoccus lacisalsi TaxID=2742202 RepID=UPI002FD51B5A
MRETELPPAAPEARVHAFRDDALSDHDAVGIAAAIRDGSISAAEAVEAAIERIADIEPRLHALQLADFERAREMARTAPSGGRGALSGVPSMLKDNVNLAGQPTTRGSLAVPARPVRHTDRFVEQFLGVGLVPLGKSRLPEFGFNASTEFAASEPTRNPWHLDYSAGASSGGAAALVASGALPIAHANDGGGSIRIPAAACGLVGLKASRGRMRTEPVQDALPVRIISDGVVARSVRDVVAFHADAERVFRNNALPPIGHIRAPGEQRRRIGIVMDSVVGHATDPETRSAVRATADLLASLGHHVDDATLPVGPGFARDFVHYWGMLSVILTAPGRWMHGREFNRARLDPLTLGLAQRYWREAYRSPATLRRLRGTSAVVQEWFEPWDIVLSPVVGHTTPPIGYLSPNHPFEELIERLQTYVSFTPINNAAGNPAISLPAGTTSDGRPIGVQLSAPLGDERVLLEIAMELEQARPWRRIQDD